MEGYARNTKHNRVLIIHTAPNCPAAKNAELIKINTEDGVVRTIQKCKYCFG